MKKYFTTDQDTEFCGRVFKAGEKYYIVKETEGHIIIRGKRHVKEQMMTKMWLKAGMFNFLTLNEEHD